MLYLSSGKHSLRHPYHIYVFGFAFAALMLFSCGSSYKHLPAASHDASSCADQFKPHFNRSLYSTQVNILHSHLSGILFIKQMTDSSTRLLFSNETGFKFFDFAFSKDGNFEVHYILDKMDRKPLIRMLEQDFRAILMIYERDSVSSFIHKEARYTRFKMQANETYLITDSACSKLQRIELVSGGRQMAVMQFTPYNEGLPDSIYIRHRGIKFNIAFKRLSE